MGDTRVLQYVTNHSATTPSIHNPNPTLCHHLHRTIIDSQYRSTFNHCCIVPSQHHHYSTNTISLGLDLDKERSGGDSEKLSMVRCTKGSSAKKSQNLEPQLDGNKEKKNNQLQEKLNSSAVKLKAN
ncbi:hypothetical protein Fot_07127 [Forsythia ovata]|uniref:Uncharacterized protein n=1 Tax=Forsythia ovata TaxID=205694 RepID=A0ABD1WXU3_9LAMI